MAGIGTAIVFINGNMTGLNKALGDADKAVKRSFGNILSYGKKLGAGLSIAGAGITGLLGGAVLKAAGYADDIEEMSQRTGLGTDSLQELKYAAEQSGGSLDGLEGAVKRMAKGISAAGIQSTKSAAEIQRDQAAAAGKVEEAQLKMGQAAARYGAGSDQARKAQENLNLALTKQSALVAATEPELAGMNGAYAKLGLSYQQLQTLKPEQQFNLLLTKVAGVADETERSALAQQVFGKQGTDLLPMLAGGAAGFEGMKQKAHELGLVMSGPAISTAAAFNDRLGALKAQFMGVAMTVGTALIPSLTPLLDKFQAIGIKVADWIAQNPTLVTNLTVGAAAFGAFALAVGPLLMALPGIVTAASGLIGVLKAAGITMKLAAGPFTGFGALLVGGLAVGGIIAGVLALGETFIKLASGSKDVSNFISRWVDSTFPNFGRAIDSVFDKIVGLIGKFKEWIGISAKRPELGAGSQAALNTGRVKVSEWGTSGPLAAAHAMGGMVRTPFQLVGERGPELAALPFNTRIFNARDTADMMRGGGNGGGGGPLVGTMNVTINTRGNKLDERECVDVLTRALKQVRASRN